MKRVFFTVFTAVLILSAVSCSNSGLSGRYVNIWTFHQKNDAVTSYEFRKDGTVVQSLRIRPFEKLNFKGVVDSAEGTWKLDGNTLIITLDDGSYGMDIVERTGNYIIFSVPARDGSILERKFIKD